MGTEHNLNYNIYDNDKESFKEFIIKMTEWSNYLILKKNIIIISIILGSLFGVSFSYLINPTFKATLTFAMDDDKAAGGNLGGALGLASSFGIDLGGSGGGGAFAATNLAELMKSRLIVEKVLLEPIKIKGRETSLAEYYIEINKLRKSWSTNPILKQINFLPNVDRNKFNLQQDSILQDIYNNLIDKSNLNILQKDKKVTILTIEVTNKDELFAFLFCKNLAKQTSNTYIESKSKKAKLNVDVLQKQVDSVKSELNVAVNGVAKETDLVYNLNPAYNIKGASSKKKQIDVQANTAILTNLVVQLELAKINLRKETPLIQLIDEPILPLEKSKLGKLKALLIFGFLSGFLTSFYIILRRLYKKLVF